MISKRSSARLNRLYEASEAFYALCGLREEIDGAGEVQSVELVARLNDDGGVVGLPLQADDFSVPGLSEDNYLGRLLFIILVLFVASADAVLQFLDHRTSGVDDIYASLAGDPIGARRFAMCPQQDARMDGECTEVVVIDRLQSRLFESRYFAAVVDDVAQTEKRTFGQFALCRPDGTGYTKAETRVCIY